MKFMIKYFVLISAVFVAGIQPSEASLLQLSHEPLFLNQTVPPALAVTLDDSGSMREGYMGEEVSQAVEQINKYFADPNINRLYYSPNIVYSPPLKADGSPFPNSPPQAAWVDGYPNTMEATVNITTKYIAVDEIVYSQAGDKVWVKLRDTARYNANNDFWQNQYASCNNGCSGTKPYYYIGATRYDITDQGELQNFANWYSYYNTRMKLARAAISRSFAGFSPSFKIAWHELNRTPEYNQLKKFEFGHRQDFFDWLFGVPNAYGTPLRQAFDRTTELFEKDSSYESDDYEGLLSCQQNFHIAISDGEWNGGLNGSYVQDDTANSLPGDTGTPNNNNQPLYADMPYTAGGYQRVYKHSKDDWLADVAFDSWVRDLKPNIPNYVPRHKADYTAHTGAEIIFNTSDEWENAEFVWNPKNDPAYWQHVVTYNVGMGLNASLVEDHAAGDYNDCPDNGIVDSKESVWASLRAGSGSCKWPDNEIDDVWHASINSRGDFFSPSDPQELSDALNEVVNSIIARVSRGGASSVTSGVVTDESAAYSPIFDSSTWSGSLLAKEVKPDHTFGDVIWDAACVLTGGECDSLMGEEVPQQNTRNIYTYDRVNKTKVSFDTDNLPDSLRFEMMMTANDYADTLFGGVVDDSDIDDIINYVAGDTSLEKSNGGLFRDRKSLMADVIHASPVIVRGPNQNYDDSFWPENSPEASNPYLDFQILQKDRKNMVYIGSNGGMLHAFETENEDEDLPAQERWAYIPSKALEKLPHLPSNTHFSYVDNTPVTRDVFINGKWRTVLIGGMRYGGQGYYALDITNGNVTEPTVLWEFTDHDDNDLGYTYGQADIVRLGSTGEWVALLPNGYNNSSADDIANFSLTGNAVLYVVRISDGQLLAKLDTGVGNALTPNGLATPTGVDSRFYYDGSTPVDSDTAFRGIDHGVETAYAGDLYGNLWRFNFQSSNPNDWSIIQLVEAPNPMYRPITIKPRVLHIPREYQSPEDDVVVMFATGKYIEVPDRDINLPASQYIVGIFDGPNSADDKLDILDDGIVEQEFTANGVFRSLSDNEVNPNTKYGWRVELTEQGERVFNPMSLLGSDILLLTSNITAGIDPCLPGGKSWLLAVNPLTGGIPYQGGEPTNIFKDVHVIINGQLVPIEGSGTGISVEDFIIGKPPILENQGGGAGSIVIEGTQYTNVIDFQSHTWRRRNWTNLLTE